MKRWLALLLCLMMCLSLIPAAAAEDIEIIDIVEPDETEVLPGGDDIAIIDMEAPAEEVPQQQQQQEEINAYDKPVIYDQTEDVKVCIGYYTRFYVYATNGEDYKWYYRASASDAWTESSAEGAKSNVLYVKGAASRNGMQYRCKVSNDKGYVYSKTMTLTVTEKPAILFSQDSVTALEGQTATIYISTSGAESYQWYYRTNANGSWNKSSAEGATTRVLYVQATAARNGYQYRCKVTNDKGSVYSDPTTLTVTNKPVLYYNPDDVYARVGSTATFYADAYGATSYQWYYRTSASGSWNKSTATGATTYALQVPVTESRDGYQYRCKISNSNGSIYTDPATLYVTELPTADISYDYYYYSEYYVGETAVFRVASEGATSYQWYYRANNNSSWAKSTATGATTSELRVQATMSRDGYQYRCKVTNSKGYVYSPTRTLWVSEKPVIRSWTGDRTAYVDSTTYFSVWAVGAESYQWYYRTSESGSWTKSTATGATTSELQVQATASRDGYQYYCLVKNSKGSTESYVMTLTVTRKPTIRGWTGDQTAYVDSTVSFYVNAEGATSYQWYYRTSEKGSWTKSTATGATTEQLQVQATASRNGYQYRCKVSNSYGEAYSNPMTLTVSELPVIRYGPYDETRTIGGTTYFYVETTGADSHQWYYRTSANGSWIKLDQQTSRWLEITVTKDMDGYQYRCKATNSKGSVYSRVATLTVTKLPVVGCSGDTTAYAGSTASFYVWAEGTGLSYQWYYRTSSSGSWTKSTATGATTQQLQVTATTSRNGYQYRCKVSNSYGDVYSEPMTLTVSELPVIDYGPYNNSVHVGYTAFFTVSATGATSYQWYYRTSEKGSWAKSSATGATTNQLQVEATEGRDGYQYRCKLTNSKGSVYSNVATLTVKLLPEVHWSTGDQTVAVGYTAYFNVSAEGAESYQWYYRTSASGSWAKSSATGATTSQLQVEATAGRNGYQYRCMVKNKYGSAYSTPATLTVEEKPLIQSWTGDRTACVGDTVYFWVWAQNATSYQWYYRTSANGSWTKSSAAGATTSELQVQATMGRNGYQYRCKVTNSKGSVYSQPFTLTVSELPIITYPTYEGYTYWASEGEYAYLYVEAKGATSYQWYYRTSENGSWAKSSASGATTNQLKVSATLTRDGYQYFCKVSNAKGSVKSVVMTLRVSKSNEAMDDTITLIN